VQQMNKVILSGRLTKDLELKHTTGGVAVATSTISVNRRFKNQQTGEREADFINIKIWRQAAENAVKYTGKGLRVSVVGTWQTRNFEGQDGKRVYVNECNVEEIEFIDFKGDNGAQSNENNQSNTNTRGNTQNANNGQYGGYNNDPFAGGGQIDISDDDLPF
jgi:single-strand DNA-binding protein